MAKQVDARDLKSLDRKVMPVRSRLRAPAPSGSDRRPSVGNANVTINSDVNFPDTRSVNPECFSIDPASRITNSGAVLLGSGDNNTLTNATQARLTSPALTTTAWPPTVRQYADQ
jgi:hypothetical protein